MGICFCTNICTWICGLFLLVIMFLVGNLVFVMFWVDRGPDDDGHGLDYDTFKGAWIHMSTHPEDPRNYIGGSALVVGLLIIYGLTHIPCCAAKKWMRSMR